MADAALASPCVLVVPRELPIQTREGGIVVTDSSDKLQSPRWPRENARNDDEVRLLVVKVAKVEERLASNASFADVVKLVFSEMGKLREDDHRRADAELARAREEWREERREMREDAREEREKMLASITKLDESVGKQKVDSSALSSKVNIVFTILGALSLSAFGLALAHLFH